MDCFSLHYTVTYYLLQPGFVAFLDRLKADGIRKSILKV